MNVRSVTCSEMLPHLQTFDILLMHGLHLLSNTIEFLERSEWSHCAMIVRSADIGIDDPDHPVLIWESTRERTVADAVLGHDKRGPMLVDFSERIGTDTVDGSHSLIAVRYMTVERTGEMLGALKATIEESHGADFPSYVNVFEDVFRSRYLGRPVPAHENFFCGELIAHTMVRTGLLPNDLDPSSMEPKDFSSKGHLPLLRRGMLSQEVFVRP